MAVTILHNHVVTATEDFRALHESGTFLLPNPHDVGTARLLAALGFSAVATTSAGFASTLGRLDMNVSRDELVAHTEAMATATDLPLNVDAERCFDDPAETVRLLASAGAAGCSIEDWNPADGRIDPIEVAVGRVESAAGAADDAGLVLTARCENHIHGVDDLDDTVTRLVAYRDAGAECVYAPGLVDLVQIARVVDATTAAVNVLLFPGGPTVEQLAGIGVRRVSVGSFLTNIAHGAFAGAARHLREQGTIDPGSSFLDGALAAEAWG